MPSLSPRGSNVFPAGETARRESWGDRGEVAKYRKANVGKEGKKRGVRTRERVVRRGLTYVNVLSGGVLAAV